jgi:hypothetical protein
MILILLMYPANFYFVAVLTWTMTVKNNPYLSDYRAVGLMACRNIATMSGVFATRYHTNVFLGN